MAGPFLLYTGCHKYVPIDQRLNFRAHRGYNLRPLQNAPFCPISVSGSNFNPQNTQCIPVVNPPEADRLP